CESPQTALPAAGRWIARRADGPDFLGETRTIAKPSPRTANESTHRIGSPTVVASLQLLSRPCRSRAARFVPWLQPTQIKVAACPAWAEAHGTLWIAIASFAARHRPLFFSSFYGFFSSFSGFGVSTTSTSVPF